MMNRRAILLGAPALALVGCGEPTSSRPKSLLSDAIKIRRVNVTEEVPRETFAGPIPRSVAPEQVQAAVQRALNKSVVGFGKGAETMDLELTIENMLIGRRGRTLSDSWIRARFVGTSNNGSLRGSIQAGYQTPKAIWEKQNQKSADVLTELTLTAEGFGRKLREQLDSETI